MRSPREQRVTWAVVLAVAFLVRLPGIGWGVPDATHEYSYHPDEVYVAGTALRMLETGDPNPRFFHYGSLPIYLTAAAAWPLFAAGIDSPGAVHLVSRWLNILLAVGSVAATMAVARRGGGPTAAGLAGFFLAVMPGHVLHSGFATVDVPAAFFVILCILLTLRAGDGGGPAGFAAAGAAAGLAAATKYNAGLVLLVPMVMAFARGTAARARAAASSRDAAVGASRPAPPAIASLAAAAGAALAFLVAMPYALLDFATFREHVAFELIEHARRGHGLVFQDTGNGWLYHVTHNLPYLATVPLAAAAVAGLGLAARRRNPVDVALLLFVVPYFVGLGFSEVRFLRYLMPLAPALAVLAAMPLALLYGARRDRWRGAGALGIAAVTLVLSLVTGRQQMAFATPDPRTASARWLARRAVPDTHVALVKMPWHYTPPVTPHNGGRRSAEAFEASRETSGWRFTVCKNWNVMALARGEPEYVLLSEFERREEQRLGQAAAARFLAHLEEHYEVVAVFDRIPVDQRWLYGLPFAPHDWLYPFNGIEIWKRRA